MNAPAPSVLAAAAPPDAAPAQPLLELRGVSKSFGSLKVLREISLRLMPGEVHCLLGENGAGKSTLCNLIFGVHQPDAGEMLIAGVPHAPARPADALASGIAMVHQHFSLVPDLTVVDNLLLGQARGVLDRKACAERVRALVKDYGLALDPFARIDELSVGERQRVEIVKCLMREPRLLVLDEPTAVLLPDEIAALLVLCRKVAERGCAVVLVTHKLAEIKQVADRATVLRGGKVVAESDAPARDIDGLVRAMIQRELGGPAAAMLGVGEARERREIVRDLANEALQVNGLSVVDAQGVTRLDNFTVVVSRGEIVGVAGVEGNGQSELAAALAGMAKVSNGRFYVEGRDLTEASPAEITAAGVGVVPEDRHEVGCITAMSVADNLHLNRLGEFRRWGLLQRGALRSRSVELMQRFDVRAASADVPFSALSGGNQQKAVLARELTLPQLRFLLAAQPTRGLDVGAVEAVYGHIRAACEQGVGVMLISSELDELLAVADRIVVLYRGRIMGECVAEPAAREHIGALMAGHGS
ncbi:ABC transporter ATP-binding protein [Niveibacterium sp. SC-1]|uniref:ABC transporter ATP-binding protein n=1 Tax=Niveibacterium sp. SC-1 TaxID=3135646 RepID=UPI00311D5A97